MFRKQETWEELSRRFHKAVYPLSNPPKLSDSHDHVFDCPNNIRFVITHELTNQDSVIHVSVRPINYRQTAQWMDNLRQPHRRFLEEVHTAWFHLALQTCLELPMIPTSIDPVTYALVWFFPLAPENRHASNR